MLVFSRRNGERHRRLAPRSVVAVLVILVLSTSALAFTAVLPSPARAVPIGAAGSGVSDDFAHDTSLNTTLWAINGAVGSDFAAANCPACVVVALDPTFSGGMKIAQIDNNSEIGTIQSIAAFAPPITVNATVEGLVSNGHPFVFGISDANATLGVQITGNLNPDDCSAETGCGNPATCGTSANASIAPDQCFYGIYGRIGSGSGNWKKTPMLDLTPSVGVIYALQISIDSSGYAQIQVSEGGLLLGESNATAVGTGPFYIILGQSEGVPVPGPGPNSALWLSASLAPFSSVTPPASSSSPSSGISPIEWSIILLVVVAVVVAIVLLAYRRRRGLTVCVVDTGTLSPLSGAGVSAEGPELRSGSTGSDGRVVFGGVKSGDYSVKASAAGYAPSPTATIPVKRSAVHTVRLERLAPPPEVRETQPAPAVSARVPPTSSAITAPPPVTSPTPAVETSFAPSPPPASPATEADLEGLGGPRIQEIARTFQLRGATSPETALTAEELGLPRLFVRIMKRRRGRTRVFVEVNGKYYLDENALRQLK